METASQSLSLVDFLQRVVGKRSDAQSSTAGSIVSRGLDSSASDPPSRLAPWKIKIRAFSYIRSIFSKPLSRAKPSSHVVLTSTPAPRLFALVISPRLSGATTDADAFSDYLKSDLNIPSDSIVVLRNEQASRTAIINAFKTLQTDTRIQRNDAIVVYYSGLGQPEMSANGIQAIVPHDYAVSTPGNERVLAISPQHITALVAGIVQNKGDNIMLIFDCCGSSVSKEEPSPDSARSVALDDGSIDASDSTTSTTVRPTAEGQSGPFVLTACSPGEVAREDNGRGRFTTALLKMLKRDNPTSLTRNRGLNHIPQIIGQTPHCSGASTDLPFFNTSPKGVPGDKVGYAVKDSDSQHVLQAGSAAGVALDAQFALYQSLREYPRSAPAATYVAEEVSLFTSILKPISDGPVPLLKKTAFAVQTQSGLPRDVVVCAPLVDQLQPFYEVVTKVLQGSSPESYRFLFTQDRAQADLALALSDDKQCLDVTVLDERASLHGFTRLPFSIPLNSSNQIQRFLGTAAHFYRYLNRSYLNPDIGNKIIVESTQLEESETDFDDDGFAVLSPASDNLFKGGVAELQLHSESEHSPPTLYGFKITNNTPFDLYPNVFYFDNSDLSATNYYPQKFPKVPLRKEGGTITIGYGSAGASPFSYFLRNGQDMDVGFLKVIFTTEPADMPSVPHAGAFEEGNDAEVPLSSPEVEGVWGSVLLTIVQRQAPAATA